MLPYYATLLCYLIMLPYYATLLCYLIAINVPLVRFDG